MKMVVKTTRINLNPILRIHFDVKVVVKFVVSILFFNLFLFSEEGHSFTAAIFSGFGGSKNEIAFQSKTTTAYTCSSEQRCIYTAIGCNCFSEKNKWNPKLYQKQCKTQVCRGSFLLLSLTSLPLSNANNNEANPSDDDDDNTDDNDDLSIDSSTLTTKETTMPTRSSSLSPPPPSKVDNVKCPNCDLCDGSGRIQGGIGAVFSWIPVKAFRPCPNFIDRGGTYQRSGQGLDEIAFGRDSTFSG